MESIFNYIQRHVTEDNRLPEGFRLSGGTNGMREGMYLHHSLSIEPESACRAALKRLVKQLMVCGTPEEGMELIAPVAKEYPAITVANSLEKEITRRLGAENWNMLSNLASIGVWTALNAVEMECVKYGLLLCEITHAGELSAAAQTIIFTLGLCEEFTAFAVFNMRHWGSGRQDIIILANQVSGWGKIAAVELLEPEEEWEEEWLLYYGWQNSVSPLYSAPICYQKAKVLSRFGHIQDKDEFLAVQQLMDCLTQTDELMDQLTLGKTELCPLELLLAECEQRPDLADSAMVERVRAYLNT